jgi:hypothetical protein
MKITRLYTGTDSQSHFDDIEVETGILQPVMVSSFVMLLLTTLTAGIVHRGASMSSTYPGKPKSKSEMAANGALVPEIFFLQKTLPVRATFPET